MQEESSAEPPGTPLALTSYHLRRARGGDEESLTWLIRRLSPLLLAAAEHRLSRTLRVLYDPEDIVADVWLVALPRLAELPDRDERFTPVLLRFLTTTLSYRIQNLVQKHIQGKPPRHLGEEGQDPFGGVAARTTDVVRRAAQREAQDMVTAAIGRLEPPDRDILILRGIEQHPYQEIGVVLGADPKVLAVRYARALERLRRVLPGSVFEELIEE